MCCDDRLNPPPTAVNLPIVFEDCFSPQASARCLSFVAHDASTKQSVRLLGIVRECLCQRWLPFMSPCSLCFVDGPISTRSRPPDSGPRRRPKWQPTRPCLRARPPIGFLQCVACLENCSSCSTPAAAPAFPCKAFCAPISTPLICLTQAEASLLAPDSSSDCFCPHRFSTGAGGPPSCTPTRHKQEAASSLIRALGSQGRMPALGRIPSLIPRRGERLRRGNPRPLLGLRLTRPRHPSRQCAACPSTPGPDAPAAC